MSYVPHHSSDAACTDLGKLEGGYIQYSDNTKVVGSVATYYCCTEYERASSNSQRMCMSDGQWNGTEFKCRKL